MVMPRYRAALFLLAATTLGCVETDAGEPESSETNAIASENGHSGYVLKYGEGENSSPPGGGHYITKASPRTGTQGAVMFYDEETPGETSGVHYHTQADEFFYVVQGRGTITLGGQDTVIEAGDTIVVLVGEDHRITSSEDDPLRVVYFLDRAGLEEQFRLKLDRAGMTLEEFNVIVREFGTVYKSFE